MFDSFRGHHSPCLAYLRFLRLAYHSTAGSCESPSGSAAMFYGRTVPYAAIAQSVEWLHRKQQVFGSTPNGGSILALSFFFINRQFNLLFCKGSEILREIYLDAAATTRPFQSVVDAVSRVMRDDYGNASAPYTIGANARNLIEEARQYIADDIGCAPDEIIFTSGACEANSLAMTCPHERLITTHLEHKSILNYLSFGAEANPVWFFGAENRTGSISNLYHKFDSGGTYSLLTQFDGRDTLISVQGANGEIGTIQDIADIRKHFPKSILHSDMTQLYAERRINVKELGLDMMSVSAQKFHGPKGVGFLYVRNGILLHPLICGSQENGLRGGTYNTPLIHGLKVALELTRVLENFHQAEVEKKRNALAEGLLSISGVHLNGPALDSGERLRNNLSLTIDGCDATQLITLGSLYGLYFNNGSACNNGSGIPSATLQEIGLTDEEISRTIRLSLDANFQDEDIDYTVSLFDGLIKRVRDTSQHESR